MVVAQTGNKMATLLIFIDSLPYSYAENFVKKIDSSYQLSR